MCKTCDTQIEAPADEPIAKLPSEFGDFEITSFRSEFYQYPHVAIIKKPLPEVVNLRIQSECMTGDVFGSLKCDCRGQLLHALNYIQEHGGIVLYLRQEGRGIGLENKIRAYQLQDEGMDTIEANLALGFEIDSRKFDVAADYLKNHDIHRVNLLTNNPEKVEQVQQHGIEVVERVPVLIESNENSERYLNTKKHQMGHYL